MAEVLLRQPPHPSDLLGWWRIRAYICANGPFDVIHGHSSKGGALARLAAVGTTAARLYTPHGIRTLNMSISKFERAFYGVIEMVLARGFGDAVIAVSEDERRNIVGLGVPAEEVHVVPNGVPEPEPVDRRSLREAMGLAVEDVWVGFVGRFVNEKGPDRMVRAMAEACKAVPRFKLAIVGDEPMEPEIKSIARDMGLNGSIAWLGPVVGERYMQGFNFLAMPSRKEGMPYTRIEALAAGLPMVTTDVGDAALTVEEGINGFIGFIVPQGDMEAFVERMIRLASDADLRSRMGVESRRKRLEFTLDQMADKTLAVYHRLLDGMRR